MPMPRAKLTKLILTELAAVPTGAQDIQGTAILKSKAKGPTSIAKRSALTSAQLGHTHVLYGIDDSMAGTTSYESTFVEGAPNDRYTGHCHPWVRAEDGSISIGEAMGHSHEVGVMSAPLAKAITVELQNDSRALTQAVVAKSTRSADVSQRESTPEGTMSNTPDLAKQLADVTKSNERLERIAKMSGAHKAHFDTLTGEDADTFLAKSNTDRETIVSEVAKRNEESNKVVYVSKSRGDVFRAKDDPRMVEMAKAMDEQFVTIEKANIRKQALEVLGGMPGSDDAHDLIVGAVLKSGAKKEEIDAALECLKGMKATSTIGKRAPGFGGTDAEAGTEGGDALQKLENGLIAFAKAQNITKNVWTDGLDAFKKTTEGAALKRAYDESQAG
jgi:hypothetical protein